MNDHEYECTESVHGFDYHFDAIRLLYVTENAEYTSHRLMIEGETESY